MMQNDTHDTQCVGLVASGFDPSGVLYFSLQLAHVCQSDEAEKPNLEVITTHPKEVSASGFLHPADSIMAK